MHFIIDQGIIIQDYLDTVAFSYLSDVRNLPAYFPHITSAEKTSGDSVRVSA